MMKQTVAILAIVGSAAAFAPVQKQQQSSSAALQAKPFAGELGAQAPVSDVSFSCWLAVYSKVFCTDLLITFSSSLSFPFFTAWFV